MISNNIYLLDNVQLAVDDAHITLSKIINYTVINNFGSSNIGIFYCKLDLMHIMHVKCKKILSTFVCLRW